MLFNLFTNGNGVVHMGAEMSPKSLTDSVAGWGLTIRSITSGPGALLTLPLKLLGMAGRDQP